MVGNLKKVQEAVRRLASLVDEAVEANRFYGMKAESAVPECLEDGEWWSISQVQQALRKGGLNLVYSSVATALRKQTRYGRLERKQRATGVQGGGVVYRRRRQKRRNERGRGGGQ